MINNKLTLDKRVDILERELSLIKSNLFRNSQEPWWCKIVGVFENDPVFEEISSLGKSIREQERREAQS